MKKALLGTTAINQHLHFVPEPAGEFMVTPDEMAPLFDGEVIPLAALEGLFISKGADPDKIRAGQYLAREVPGGIAVVLT